MATIAPGLNFRIGADVKGINKAIKEAEKSLQGAVQSFSSIGNSLSLALSAPLAAFGVMSIKAAGQMESLRFALEGTMKDAGRSVGEARNELEALREAALKPGLDFEQAVRGSVRLQSVGKSAEEARRIIVQLGNALALSGGTAGQLDGVTKQFAQMSGKGKIMQEDLSIILENMPALAKVMQETFGTTNAEMLRDMGVSVEDFIARLTTGMEALPRAQGGIANSIVNAQNAIQQALASTGEEINRVFNISGALNAFSEWVANMATAFKNLDDDTKRVIGAVVVFAATLGPALIAVRYLVSGFGGMVIALKEVQKWLALTSGAQGLQGAVKWFTALNIVTKASILGGIAAVALAAAAAFAVFSKETNYATESQKKINESLKEVTKETGNETAALNRNFAVLKDVNSTYEQRQGAIKALQEQYPEYLGNVDLEKMSLGQLETVQNRVNQSILKSIAARKQAMLIDEQYAKIADTMLRISDIEKRGFDALSGEEVTRAGRSLFGTEFEKRFVMAEAKAATVADVIKALKSDIDNANVSIKQIGTSFEQTFDAGQSVVGTDAWAKYYKEVEGGTKKIKDQKNEVEKSLTPFDAFLANVKKQSEAQRKWNEAIDAFGLSELKEAKPAEMPKITSDSMSFESIWSGFDAMDKASDNAKKFSASVVSSISPAQAILKGMKYDVMSFSEAYEEASKVVLESGSGIEKSVIAVGAAIAAAGANGTTKLSTFAESVKGTLSSIAMAMVESGHGMQALFVSIGAGIASAISQNVTTLKGFTKAVLAESAKVIKVWIQMAVARAALSAMQNVPFPFNIAAAAAAGGIAAGLFGALVKKVGIPALAEGGVLSSPRLVMAGEYPGARTNPEIVTPENKMRDVMGEMLQRFGGAGGGTLTARVSGDDLLFVLEKAQVRQKRIR